jgi:hypothetical protein
MTLQVNCSPLKPARYFDFKDEQNLTQVLNTTIAYNIKYGVTNNTFKTIYGSLTDINNFSICIDDNYAPVYYAGYGEIQYSKAGFEPRRYYLFENASLSNATLINTTLYHVIEASAQSFIFEFTNTQLTPYSSKYSALLHWYPDLDAYKVVDMGKTDEFGKTIMKVIPEDVDYRVGLYNLDGTLINLADPARIKCADTPCTYSIQIDTTSSNDYPNAWGVDGALTFNTTSNTYTYIWSDPSMATASYRLLVKKITGVSEITICDDVTAGFTGAMSCDISAYNGTTVAEVYRIASPPWPIATLMHTVTNAIFKGSMIGLFIAMIVYILSTLIGLYAPIPALIFGISGLLMAVALQIMSIPIFVGFVILHLITIHLIKKVS